MRARLRAGAAWLALAALAPSALAATYTCIGANGSKSFSDRPCPAGSSETARKGDAPRPGSDAQGQARRHGLSFGLMPLDASDKDVRPAIAAAGSQAIGASCHAAPAPTDRPRGGTCDPYEGDTLCSRSLPLLCIRPGVRSARKPTVVHANSGQITPPPESDSLAQLGAGPITRGDRLGSEAAATAMCEQALGAGWRMARFHDDGGWRIPALRHSSLPALNGPPGARSAAGAERYWVAIADQRANCWDPTPPQAAAPAPQRTRPAGAQSAEERQMLDEVRQFRSKGHYAKLTPHCRGIFDRVERGLRQANGEWAVNPAASEPLSDLLQHCSEEIGRLDIDAAAAPPPR
jgi:hypothetical protein